MSQGLGIERPVTPPPAFDAIPRVLRQEPAWIAWRWEWLEQPGKPGRWDKPPYILATSGPDAGCHASTTDPRTWRPFEDAEILFDADPTRWDGIGMVLVAGLACVDLDSVIDSAGAVHPEARRLVERFDSYTEISPSGRGLHIFVRGTAPNGWRKAAWRIPIEMYDFARGRYMTVTGRRWTP